MKFRFKWDQTDTRKWIEESRNISIWSHLQRRSEPQSSAQTKFARAFVIVRHIENRKLPFGQRPSFRCAAAPKPRGRISSTTACNQQERRQQRCITLWRTRVDITARQPDTGQINCERKVGSINAPGTSGNHGRKNPHEDKSIAARDKGFWQSIHLHRALRVRFLLKGENYLIRAKINLYDLYD